MCIVTEFPSLTHISLHKTDKLFCLVFFYYYVFSYTYKGTRPQRTGLILSLKYMYFSNVYTIYKSAYRIFIMNIYLQWFFIISPFSYIEFSNLIDSEGIREIKISYIQIKTVALRRLKKGTRFTLFSPSSLGLRDA